MVYEPGVGIDRTVPTLHIDLHAEYFSGVDIDNATEVVHRSDHPTAEVFYLGAPPGVPEPFSLRATGVFEPPETGPYVFSLVQAGRVRLSVGGRVVIDGMADPLPRDPNRYFGFGSEERVAEVRLEGGQPVDVLIEYSSEGVNGVYTLKVGCRAESRPTRCRGRWRPLPAPTQPSWWLAPRMNGSRRASIVARFRCPGQQDELIEQVAAVNSSTIVVVNSGAPVTMPWVDSVNAIAQLWFGGQEMANALADVVMGVTDPGGRLPTTMPLELEHNPSFGNFPGEYDEVRYGEGLLVGYRWYEARRLPVRFPFGYGLSYTSFEMHEPTASSTAFRSGDTLEIDVSVTNTGDRAGSEVVQCYVAPRDQRSCARPRSSRRSPRCISRRVRPRRSRSRSPTGRSLTGIAVPASGPRSRPGCRSRT